jgi:ParB family chromosome partitioning protein
MKLKEMAIGRGGDTLIFDPELIQEKSGYNSRDLESPETVAHIRQMADSIKASGTATFPPITIGQEDGIVYVYAGYCRRRAFVLARQEGAPIKGILCVANNQKEDERTLDLLNSNDGLPLTPLEAANVVKRLIAFSWTSAEIAKRRGVTVQAINNMLALLDAPAPVVQMVQNGEISATFAIETVRKEGAIFGTEKLKDAVAVAKEQGKDHATKKHLPKVAVRDICAEERAKRLAAIYGKVADAPEITDGYIVDTVTGPLTITLPRLPNCSHCPVLEKALLKIINAKNSEDQQQQIMNARKLIKN